MVSPWAAAFNEDGLQSLLKHWPQRRIDSPLNVIGRLDEAAKRLIAVGGIVLGEMIKTIVDDEAFADYAVPEKRIERKNGRQKKRE